ncbi:MAG: DUF4366 domain-containing protein, partial [Clostridiales bacterium]|nr:DUF4366 domain-containing protein [Clostridiales bacterium]
ALTADEQPEQSESPGETPAPQPKKSNAAGLVIMLAVIAAGGGGAFWYFKVLKPKQGEKKTIVAPDFDEFDFEPDGDDLFSGGADEQDSAEYDSNNSDNGGEIPDFTAKDKPEDGDSFGFDFGGETPESGDNDE